MSWARRLPPPLLWVVIVAAVVRLGTLGTQSLWEDETVTRWLLGHPFERMLHLLPRTESTPPFFYVVSWLWSRVAGLEEWSLRLPSALAGLAAVAVVYALARELAGPRAPGWPRSWPR